MPTVHQIGALAGVLTVLLEDERPPAPDPVPPAYRSRWRRAAIEEAAAPAGRRH